jgi:hypothetical protein
MDDLASAMRRLGAAFPGDAGPDHDAFVSRDSFDELVWYGKWMGSTDADRYDDLLKQSMPRIFRLLFAGELSGGYSDHLPDRFAEAGWPDWPAPQRDAVNAVLHAWWRATLTHHPTRPAVGDVLAVLAQLSNDVQPWLDMWSAIGGVPAARQLVELMSMYYIVPWDALFFDGDAADEALGRWLLRDGPAILTAAPDREVALARFAGVQEHFAWLTD